MRLISALLFITGTVTAGIAVNDVILPPLSSTDRDDIIPNSYLVKLRDGVEEDAVASHFEWLRSFSVAPQTGLQATGEEQMVLAGETMLPRLAFTYDLGEDFRGYNMHAGDEVMEEIRHHRDVELVEPDRYIYASANVHPLECTNETQSQFKGPWGLGRVSHQNHENLSWPFTFSCPGLGYGVDVYILDTGIFAEHADFTGRIAQGTSVVPGEPSTDDLMGHGTHCAGTIGGSTFGVAKDATLIPVKVLGANGVGGSALLVKGMEWVLGRHQAKLRDGSDRRTFRGTVLSMSLGGKKTASVNRAAATLTKLGLHLVAAAGNEGEDACETSPGSSPNVTTVGAVDSEDKFAPFSNWGSCVDVNAPGVFILSAGLHNRTGEMIMSGSSMAGPHVAGVVASLLSRQPIDDEAFVLAKITPAQLKSDLLHISSKTLIDVKSLPNDTVDRIVYSGGAKANYYEIIEKGGWPECCTAEHH